MIVQSKSMVMRQMSIIWWYLVMVGSLLEILIQDGESKGGEVVGGFK